MIRRHSLFLAQFGAALTALGGMAFAPPARGRMLLVPLLGGASVSATAVDGGARLIGPGPFGGSLVVVGERARIGLPALRQGMLLMSAPAMLCGPGGAGEDI